MDGTLTLNNVEIHPSRSFVKLSDRPSNGNVFLVPTRAKRANGNAASRLAETYRDKENERNDNASITHTVCHSPFNANLTSLLRPVHF
jgi:hypothetical protein